jgi:hypothetical protein
MAKFARIRQIGNTFYLPFLFLLFIGEFTITAPAFRVLARRKGWNFTNRHLAVSGLSVGQLTSLASISSHYLIAIVQSLAFIM